MAGGLQGPPSGHRLAGCWIAQIVKAVSPRQIQKLQRMFREA
jgi:hypothetical protein